MDEAGDGKFNLNWFNKIVESQESWIYSINPGIRGKSGVTYQFDYSLYYLGSEQYLIPCLKLTPEKRNRLAAIAVFNAHCDDVGAYRKVVITDRSLSSEERLLTNALKIEVFSEVTEMRRFLEGSLVERMVNSGEEVRSVLSMTRASKAEKSRKKYRDRTKLIQEVLTSASVQDGATLNNIVFKCNLNYNSAKKIVDDLLKKELIRIEKDEEDKVVYRITGNGSKLAEKLSYMDRVNEPE